jgi:hypothetical protein
MRLRLVDKRVFLQLEKRSMLVRQILEKALRKHHAVRPRLPSATACFEPRESLTLPLLLVPARLDADCGKGIERPR